MEIQSNAAGHSPAIYLTHTGNQGRRFRIASFGDNATPGSFVIRDDTPGETGEDRLTIDRDGKFRIRYGGPVTGDTNFVLSFQNAIFNSNRFSGISTEGDGNLINFGINTGREGAFNVALPGFLLRADLGFFTGGFQFIKKTAGTGAESELMRIDESGNVGIGTTTPAAKLHVSGTGIILGNVGIGTTTPATRLHVSGTGIIRARVESDSNAGLALALGNQPKWSVATVTGGHFQIFNDALGHNDFWIDIASDNIGIGTTTPADKLHVAGDIRVGTSGTNGCLKNNNGGAIVGTCSSDARFKRDITPFPNLLSRIVQLRPVHFRWRAEDYPDRNFGQALEAGLIAQEVEKVMPELVTEDEQGYKAGNYAKLPLLTLQAVKELQQENDALKRENAALKQQQQAQFAAQQTQVAAQTEQLNRLVQQIDTQQREFERQQNQFSRQHQALEALERLVRLHRRPKAGNRR